MNDLNKQIEKLEQDLAELKAIANKPKPYTRWKPEQGNSYFTGVYPVKVKKKVWLDDNMDMGSYALGNVFKTEEEALNKLDRDLALVRVQDKIMELDNGEVCDWGSGSSKYTLMYHHRNTAFQICEFQILQNSTLYSPNESTLQYIIDHMRDDLKLIWEIKEMER